MIKTPPITEADLYAEFDTITRPLLKYWKNRIIELGDQHTTLATIADINQRLRAQNVVVFFDHHYAFDAIPVTLALGQYLKNVTGALIPYAVHLDMGVNREGLPSLRYRLRTLAFHWLIKNIQRANPTIKILPVAREFELDTPRLKAIADCQFPGSNVKYLKTFIRMFADHNAGWLCILSPMAGIAFPEKPALHPQIYRSIELVQAGRGQLLTFYFVSAYPRLHAHHHYMAPLLTKHIFVARGPFNLPVGNYEEAQVVATTHLQQLRQAGQFTALDYSRISQK
jgi:hypothetical protein